MNAADEVQRDASQITYLQELAEQLRVAIRESLEHGRPQHAVALDTVRDFAETVLLEPSPTSTRIAVARTRAEIALEVWRDARDVRH